MRVVSKYSLLGALTSGVLALAILGYFLWIRAEPGPSTGARRAVLEVPEIPSSQALIEAPLADFDWSIFDLDGSEIPFATFKGKVVFLSFWATWCVPCVVEMPSIQALKEALPGRNVAFALVADQSPKVLKEFLAKHHFDLPFYRVPEIPKTYRTEEFPTTFIIDANGRIALREDRAVSWDTPEFIAFAKALVPQ